MSVRMAARLAVVVLLCGSTAWAQTTQQLPDPEIAEWLQCLVRPAGGPAYPDFDKDLNSGGLVRVKLTFSDHSDSPEFQVLTQLGSKSMVDEVRHFVRAYRVPCLPKGRRLELIQSFAFTPRGEVEGYRAETVPPVDLPAYERCLVTPEKPQILGMSSSEASRIQRKPTASNLIVALSFSAVGQPPELQVIYDTMEGNAREVLLEHLREYRASCLPQPGKVWRFSWHFKLGDAEESPTKLRDMGLVPLLRMVKGLDRQRVRMDLTTMACPFQVRWTLGMPVHSNRVSEVGPSNLNRLEFLQWMRGLTLNLNPAQFERLLGQSMVVDVPCANIALDPLVG